MGFAIDGERRIASGEVGGDLAYREKIIRTLLLADVTMKDVSAHVTDQKASAFGSRTIAGNIGAGILSRFRMVIDFRAKRIVFNLSNAQHETGEIAK